MKSRDFLNLLMVILLILFANWLASFGLTKPSYIYVVGFGVLPVYYFFRIYFSRKVRYKGIIMAKANILSAKNRGEISIDVDRKTALEFLLELEQEANWFSFIDFNRASSSILFKTKANWLTWGADVYITISESSTSTCYIRIDIASYQVYNWGENEKILEKFKTAIDNKLNI